MLAIDFVIRFSLNIVTPYCIHCAYVYIFIHNFQCQYSTEDIVPKEIGGFNDTSVKRIRKESAISSQ